MYIRFDNYHERVLYSKIVAALTDYEESENTKEDSKFFAEYFYSLLCEIQNIIDSAEKDNI